MRVGHVRFWFEGEGRLVELPELELDPAGDVAPKGVSSFYQLDLDFLGSEWLAEGRKAQELLTAALRGGFVVL